MRGVELGQVKEGYLADLLLVDGDPLANLGVLQDRARILAVMKDGAFHREPPVRSARASAPRWLERTGPRRCTQPTFRRQASERPAALDTL